MVVPVAEGPEDDQAATYWLGRWPTVAPPTLRWGPGAEVVAALGAGVIGLALTAGLIAGVPFSDDGPDPCLGSTFLGTDGQCVGVAEGAASFGKEDGEGAVRDVLQRIEQQNGQVEDELSGRDDDDPRPAPVRSSTSGPSAAARTPRTRCAAGRSPSCAASRSPRRM
jgi:hypothetical protein